MKIGSHNSHLESPLRRVARNGLHAVKGESGAALFNAAAMAIMANALGPAGFGVLAIYLAYAELFGRLCYPQCWEALVRHAHPGAPEFHQRLVSVGKLCARLDGAGCLAAVAACLLGLSALELLAGLDDAHRSAGLILCLLPLGWIADSAIGVFRLLDRFDVYSRIQWAIGLLKVTAVGTTATLDASLASLAAAYVIPHIAGALIKAAVAVYTLRAADADLRVQTLGISKAFESGTLHFIWHQHLNVSLRSAAVKLDLIVLSYFATPAVVGVYRAAIYIGNVLNSAVSPIFAAYYPEAATLATSGSWPELRKLSLQTCLGALCVGIAGLLIFAVVGAPMITVLFGEGFSATYHLTLIYQGAVAIALAATPLYSLMLALGAAGAALRSQFIAVSAFTLLLVPTIWLFGAAGAAAAHIGYYLVWLLATTLFLRGSAISLAARISA